ncbi:hypothetical protein CH254_15800 [Rhodococcus sp. 06-412-2C]|uniref:hypothetical protein n=1 Tax=unclassified Rhodococcus (in: high G+C Gram-positive bacteria) TaxID=192944 RepID=UPI000B9BFCB9|nr:MULTISPECIES: hypothetical protein [unclassified Rhodococcus (in: high G+C Gram-positive bacteria)]OZC87149.1 hypothetical protein CH254_15800 [Rhodococcus sp. 06-412-2C]OZD00589.1 hypothetical protein CH279_06165 [Rhodococcus sp. 06-412-2B]
MSDSRTKVDVIERAQSILDAFDENVAHLSSAKVLKRTGLHLSTVLLLEGSLEAALSKDQAFTQRASSSIA